MAPTVQGRAKFIFILSKEPHKQRQRFLEKVREYGLEQLIVVRDSQPRNQLLKYVKSSDFVVIPSITEGFGLTTAESCKLGKKVIHSNGGSLPEVASGLTLSFENRDSEDLARKLIYAFQGGEFKFTPVKAFTEEDMVRSYIKCYKEVCQ